MLYINTSEMQHKLSGVIGFVIIGIIVGIVLLVIGITRYSAADRYSLPDEKSSAIFLSVLGGLAIFIPILVYILTFASMVSHQ